MLKLSVEVREMHYKNYGKCVSIHNGLIQTIVTIDVGPRIIFFGPSDGPNLLYNDLERKFIWNSTELQAHFGEGSQFILYGGHRLWTAPERFPDSYIPDNSPVVYTLLPEGVRFTAPIGRNSAVQLSFEIVMTGDTQDMMVVHCAQNISHEEQTLSLWGITALQPGGQLLIPQNERASAAPNRTLSFWPFTDIQDPRFFFGNRYLTLKQISEQNTRFKIGMNNQLGWAAYLMDQYAFVKRFVYNHEAQYPDNGSSVEAFAHQDLLELQTLSPLYRLEPKEMVRHVENWSVFTVEKLPDTKSEDALDQFVNTNL